MKKSHPSAGNFFERRDTIISLSRDILHKDGDKRGVVPLGDLTSNTREVVIETN